MNDAHYPWFILVPDRDNVSELFEMSRADQLQLMRESCLLSGSLKPVFRADKMNVAALGNLVPQLHVHHVVRYRDDPAWPDPIWGKHTARVYEKVELKDVLKRVRQMKLVDFIPDGILQ